MLVKIFLSFPFLPFILFPIRELCILYKVAVARLLSPLRRIVTRELRVHRCYPGTAKPMLFTVVASLECGHSFTELEWNFRDLLNAYTEAPEVNAKRHRCHECRDLATTKKPVTSVPVEAVAVAA
jgi:hypothetical protein